jgi:8-amino-7-oxononanoate synthase
MCKVSWSRWASAELEALRSAQRLRRLTPFDGIGPRGCIADRPVVSFAGNDYLGLATHPRVCLAAQEAIDKYGTSATASRLVVGTRPLHAQLEFELAEWQGVERALVFPTGFAADIGVVATLGTAGVTIFSDELNHASIIDGCRLARATTLVYRHVDLDHLRSLLRKTGGRKIIVTDSVFSMDGDIAPIEELTRLCARHDALLVLDEAHAVLEPQMPTSMSAEVLRVGTLSKTLGSLGGWVAGSSALIELLMNRARSFIYTTALSPADTAAALAALRIVRSSEGEQLRQRLRIAIDRIRCCHPSPIVPIVLGDDCDALAASERLLARGIWVPAIRPPTVPRGTARLRIALSAAHSDAMIAQLQDALASILDYDSLQRSRAS